MKTIWIHMKIAQNHMKTPDQPHSGSYVTNSPCQFPRFFPMSHVSGFDESTGPSELFQCLIFPFFEISRFHRSFPMSGKFKIHEFRKKLIFEIKKNRTLENSGQVGNSGKNFDIWKMGYLKNSGLLGNSRKNIYIWKNGTFEKIGPTPNIMILIIIVIITIIRKIVMIILRRIIIK